MGGLGQSYLRGLPQGTPSSLGGSRWQCHRAALIFAFMQLLGYSSLVILALPRVRNNVNRRQG